MICIQLDQWEFDCLSVNAPDGVKAVFKVQQSDNESGYVLLEPSLPGLPPGKPIQLYVSNEEGEELLKVAQTHCEEAVYWIKEALAGR